MKRLLKFLKIALLLALISATLERLAKLTNKLRINLTNKV
jgi:hypothetical protein